MNDEFLLPVIFNGKELEFSARLLNYGFSSRLEVEVEGTKVLYEPDEERKWRAVISYEDVQANKKLNVDVLKAIAEAIEALLG